MLAPFLDPNAIEAGCDEAGRGCLAGPVFAAAVILPKDFSHPLLRDSKQLSEKNRQEVRKEIEAGALAWAVAKVDAYKIDEINILNASFHAMHLAIKKLSVIPTALIIDGNRFIQFDNIPHTCIVKGDGKYRSIAAASILAKTYRDNFMMEIAVEYPHYAWQKNKGYPTKAHRAAIYEHGPSPYHRRSFKLLPDAFQGKLF